MVIPYFLKNRGDDKSGQRAVAIYRSYHTTHGRRAIREQARISSLPTTIAVPCSLTAMSLFLVLDRYRKPELTRDISCPVRSRLGVGLQFFESESVCHCRRS